MSEGRMSYPTMTIRSRRHYSPMYRYGSQMYRIYKSGSPFYYIGYVFLVDLRVDVYAVSNSVQMIKAKWNGLLWKLLYAHPWGMYLQCCTPSPFPVLLCM